jgi:hypothetical protein
MKNHDHRDVEHPTSAELRKVAFEAGIMPNDPLAPFVETCARTLDAVYCQQKELARTYEMARNDIVQAMNERSEYARQQAAHFRAEAEATYTRLTADLGDTIARASEEALTERVQMLELKTVVEIVICCLLAVIGSYSIGHAFGYSSGQADEHGRAVAEETTMRDTASEAAKLFIDHTDELAVWAPIIRLNHLAGSSSLAYCFGHAYQYVDNPAQLGCWLAVRIETPQARPKSIDIPILPPPVSSSPDGQG